MTDSDAAHAVLFGLALGDALGWPIEFLELSQIRAKYRRAGVNAPANPAQNADETQKSLAVAGALIEAGEEAPELNRLMGARLGPHAWLTRLGNRAYSGEVAEWLARMKGQLWNS